MNAATTTERPLQARVHDYVIFDLVVVRRAAGVGQPVRDVVIDCPGAGVILRRPRRRKIGGADITTAYVDTGPKLGKVSAVLNGAQMHAEQQVLA